MSYDKINKLWICNLCNKLVGNGYMMVAHIEKEHPRENAKMLEDLNLK